MVSTLKKKAFLYICIIIVIAFFTYFWNYQQPANLFWDENYHIASAYKYLNGIFFMEPHPPLGKLFIALGEYLIHPNTRLDTSYFLKTDYITSVPAGFSFVGVRFFPALFGMFSGVIFFLILFSISGNLNLSALFSSFYLFDNALILQSRGAMLESIQIFFVLMAVWYFCHLLKKNRLNWQEYLILGFLIGITLSIKLNSIVFILLLLFLMLYEIIIHKKKWQQRIMEFCKKGLVFFTGVLVVYIGAYYVHIIIGTHVIDHRYYEASEGYKTILDHRETGNFLNFPLMLKDQLSYIPHYEKGVPKYDPNKIGENGSLPYRWLVGGKTINYRWEKKGEEVKYLYLIDNPFIWFFGLLILFLSTVYIIMKFLIRILQLEKPVKSVDRQKFLLVTLFAVYIIYMFQMFRLDRVMYLYHYFIPLLLSLIMGFILFVKLCSKQWKTKNIKVLIGTILLILIVFSGYIFFSPFTYYQPLRFRQFQMRNWFPFWQMEAVK